ncbi:type VI secretion system ImpA family N-terminal domain-containing protein [Enterobacter kobei]|nr:type VI secretion system ImpA family N-terminal domain-containing protein [Enterobacter kobei]
MNNMTPRKIKTGGDPRALPDYAALRDELSKLTHPARPDVNWRYAEKLCLSLFEQNGVELQTAAWYTLARTQLAGLFGLNEGLTILEALISHQWGTLWPQPVHARMEILSSLSLRLQQRMRTLALNYGDLSQLYRAEQLLGRLGTVLQRLELKHLSQLDVLRTLMHNSAVRLENSDGTGANIQPGIVLPSTMMNGSTASTRDLAGGPDDDFRVPDSAVKWVYVAQPEQQPNVDVLATMPAPVKKWKSFVGGMCTMLLISAIAVWGWQYLHRLDPLQTQFAASLAPLPAILTPAQLDKLRQQSPLPQAFITQIQQQLARLGTLPPGWNIDYSRQLLEQAQALWPEQTKHLVQQWQRQLNAASSIPTENLNGWHQGMTKLQQLSDRLNGLDEQKGKYMTVSELKSVVFSTMQSFNQSIPAEEQLRVLSQTSAGEPLQAAGRAQLEMHLKQLTTRYTGLVQPEMHRITDTESNINEY